MEEAQPLTIQERLSNWEPLKPQPNALTLYWANGSIPTMRIKMALALKNVPYHSVRLRIMTNPKQTKLPEFLALNPRGKTPTIVDDIDGNNIVMYESQGILNYLERRFPQPSLIPNDIKLVSLMYMRQAEADTFDELIDPLEYIFLRKKERVEYLPQIRMAQSQTIEELESLWDGYLSQHRYLAGDEITLADCAFWPIIGYLAHHQLPLNNPKLQNVARYYHDIRNSPCGMACWPEGWEHPGRHAYNPFK